MFAISNGDQLTTGQLCRQVLLNLTRTDAVVHRPTISIYSTKTPRYPKTCFTSVLANLRLSVVGVSTPTQWQTRLKISSVHPHKLECHYPPLTVSRWPTHKVVWIVGDSVLKSLFLSVACHLESAVTGVTFPSTNMTLIKLRTTRSEENVDLDVPTCVMFVNGGKVCLYPSGCVSGECYLPWCPYDKTHPTCMDEILQLIHERPTALFLGVNAHVREDEMSILENELEMVRAYKDRLLSYADSVYWLSPTAQHFATVTERHGHRIMRTDANRVKRTFTCKPAKMANGKGKSVLPRYVQRQLDAVHAMNITIVPLHAISQVAYNMHIPQKPYDCTHYGLPGVPDLWSDVLSVFLNSRS